MPHCFSGRFEFYPSSVGFADSFPPGGSTYPSAFGGRRATTQGRPYGESLGARKTVTADG